MLFAFTLIGWGVQQEQAAHAADSTCSAEYILSVFANEEFIDVSADLLGGEYAEGTRRALPNVKRAFVEQSRMLIILVGWEKSWENLSRFSIRQLEA